jgi:hypothetical protein
MLGKEGAAMTTLDGASADCSAFFFVTSAAF